MRISGIPLMIIALISLTGGSCELPFEKELTSQEFLIRQGEHYATPRLTETFGPSSLKFRATFDESARYTFEDRSMQQNKNKLMGFSDCSSLHHENSARFAWQWFNDQLEIYAYCYVDSVRVEEFLGVVEIGEENLYELTIGEEAYDFYLDGAFKTSVKRSDNCPEGTKYLLYPYFGGTVPAPHDVKVKIEMIR